MYKFLFQSLFHPMFSTMSPTRLLPWHQLQLIEIDRRVVQTHQVYLDWQPGKWFISFSWERTIFRDCKALTTVGCPELSPKGELIYWWLASTALFRLLLFDRVTSHQGQLSRASICLWSHECFKTRLLNWSWSVLSLTSVAYVSFTV